MFRKHHRLQQTQASTVAKDYPMAIPAPVKVMRSKTLSDFAPAHRIYDNHARGCDFHRSHHCTGRYLDMHRRPDNGSFSRFLAMHNDRLAWNVTRCFEMGRLWLSLPLHRQKPYILIDRKFDTGKKTGLKQERYVCLYCKGQS